MKDKANQSVALSSEKPGMMISTSGSTATRHKAARDAR
jgi:hypothetical protein